MMKPEPHTPHFVSPENRYCGRRARPMLPPSATARLVAFCRSFAPSHSSLLIMRSAGTLFEIHSFAGFSLETQRDASIADQLRVCRAYAERQGWTTCEEYTDHAVSGATLLRAGFQALMRDALNRRFDVVLAEALDRFSRDQEDTAGLFKRLTFAGVNNVTLAEGDITHLHVGLKGTMNALFLKDLADRTRRGLRG